MKTQILDYDRSLYPFRRLIEDMVGLPSLESLHLQDGLPAGIVMPGKDNHTKWHNLFYEALNDSVFLSVYNAFLAEVIQPMFNEPLVAQDRPTFRIHWVGNKSVGGFHRDTDYNHPPDEINFWVPVTRAEGTSTIWIESAPGAKDFAPWELGNGQMLQFDGGRLEHGNKVNGTQCTRVSFDFRVIPLSKYQPPVNPKKGLAHGKEFKIGSYYRVVGLLNSNVANDDSTTLDA